jgi:hypothetical protein
MKEHTQSWHIGWIAATIAVLAAALLIIDIAAHRGETIGDVFGAAARPTAYTVGALALPSDQVRSAR